MRKIMFLAAFVVVLMGFCFSNALAAEQPDTSMKLSLKEAIDMAAKNNTGIKIQKEVTEQAKDKRESAVKDVKNFTPDGGASPEIEAAYSSLLQADLSYNMQRKEIENQTDELTLNVYGKYMEIRSLEEKTKALQKTMEEMEWKKNTARVQLGVGVMATTSMVGVDAELQQAQSDLASVKDEIDKAYVELNKYLGLNPEDRPELTDSIPYEPMEVDDVDFDAERAVNNSIDIWQALQKITLERKDLLMVNNDYKVEKHDIDIAEMNMTQAKDELRKQVHLLYHDINTMQESIKAVEQGIQSAKEALRVKNVEFEVGMASKGDVLTAEKNLANAEKSLVELKYNHAVAVANYRNFIGRSILPNEKA
ncbi:Outer membrane efflux protein [Desulfotomaculum arcticum]|uniref:Outer membrane efflux protein n=1 Tax=Desulfotruncus arcticus DSM 17038 TaxID=1121424 RepID=A0A1I2X0K8_9FIRM|nr:TolC family protein [Desulfotruncus arcticus]SFH06557.1 Outer membrane efflux protein [Desulfotomaculum arcticum] [Desulfotruncus arcticus DSM 17038]